MPVSLVHVEVPSADGAMIHRYAGPSSAKSRSRSPRSPVGTPRVTMGVWALTRKGEDFWDVRQVVHAHEKLCIALIADGHGGKKAAQHCAKEVIDDLLAAAGDSALAIEYLFGDD